METGAMNIPIKVSFVIPAYNEEDYIGHCLDAVFRNINGRKDIEVIVVDNNSTDRTAEVAARYKGVRLLHEMRPGANAARRRGFDEAKGDLVALPDADTIPPQGWLSDAEAEFAKDPKLVCVSGPFIYYDLPKRIRFMARMFYGGGYLLYLMGRSLLRTTTIIQGGNYVARRDAVAKANGLDPSISFYGDDTDLALKLSKVGKVEFSLKMKTLASGRRLAEEGAWMMGLRYAFNNFWMVVARRPWTTSSLAVRFKNGETVYSPSRRSREAVVATLFFAFCVAVLAAIAYLIYHLFVTI
jgi:cellulose synthase/poly-beta-1,6-N-acetylglucosamine synthase-like glycosyltransferase